MYLTGLRRTCFWTSECISALLKLCLVMFADLLPHTFTFNLMFPRISQQQATKRNASSSINIVGYTEDNNDNDHCINLVILTPFYYILHLQIIFGIVVVFAPTDRSKFLICENFLGNQSDSDSDNVSGQLNRLHNRGLVVF